MNEPPTASDWLSRGEKWRTQLPGIEKIRFCGRGVDIVEHSSSTRFVVPRSLVHEKHRTSAISNGPARSLIPLKD
jgi:hypothetical protein